MTAYGNPDGWADLFPEKLIPEILELVTSTWDTFEKPARNAKEVPISLKFVAALRRSKEMQQIPFTIDPEIIELDDTGQYIGRLDIRFKHGYRENVYFAIECKRLRIKYENQMKSNASEYVGTDGMMCFITGKYAATLSSGGMLGYVMDGDVATAMQSVETSIKSKKAQLCITSDPVWKHCSYLLQTQHAKESEHTMGQHYLTIYHVFLAI